VRLAGNKEDLQNLVAIRHLLSGKPFILILPDRRDGTTAIGHSLGPRFLTYADGNLAEVVAVLEKMIENYNSKRAATRSAGPFGNAGPHRGRQLHQF